MGKNCHICGGETKDMLDFGRQPIANALLSPGEIEQNWYLAVWAWCGHCSLLQLTDAPSAGVVFTTDYPYISAESKFMTAHFEVTAKYLSALYALPGKKVLEIACNSGGIIEFLGPQVDAVGVEPAQACWPILESKGLAFYRGFFDRKLSGWLKQHHQVMDLIYVANTLRSLDGLPEMLHAILGVLAVDGVLVIEEPYLVNIVDKNEFDQFYGENVYCFTVTAMQKIAARFGLEVIRVDALPDNHGGSLRYHLARPGRHRGEDLSAYLEREKRLPDDVLAMRDRAGRIASNFKAELQYLRESGQAVCGYGATAKSVTLLNWQNIGVDLLPYIYDTTPTKIGKLVPGVRIPIRDATEFVADPAQVVVLFPYNHQREITERENAVLKRRWLVYAPDVHFV